MTHPRMRVALVSYNFGEYCIRLANSLVKDVDLLLVMPEHEVAPHRARLDSRVELHTFAQPRLRQPYLHLKTIIPIHWRVRQFNPDIIHFQHGHMWFNMTLPLLKRVRFPKRIPLVVSIHDPRHHSGDKDSQRTPQWMMDFGYLRADRAIVHGEQIRQVCVEQVGVRNEIIHTIPPVPDVIPGEAATLEQIEEDDRLVLFFGRIWGYKGLDYLIRAEPLISKRVPDVKIMIAGKGEEFDRYEQMMVNRERFIIHNDYIPVQQRDEYFKRASIIVLPYIDATISGVIPVAYTFGKPVIATTVGILPEMVDHGETGLLVEPKNETALADAVVQLLEDPARRHRMGAQARKKIETDLSPDTLARQTIEVYEHTRHPVHATS